jgi:hypothetical protein
LSKLGENPLLGPLANLQRAVTPSASAAPGLAVEGAVPDKKERKKRQHDPNAPKRPLTPFFLYMQTARPIIAVDLGDGVAKGAVSEEGTRRWKEMEEKDRTVCLHTQFGLHILILPSSGPMPTKITFVSTMHACTLTKAAATPTPKT